MSRKVVGGFCLFFLFLSLPLFAQLSLIKTFGVSDGPTPGFYPYSTLALKGTTVFGTTVNGGFYSGGILFKVETDGSGFQVLHEFGATSTDGAYPQGALRSDGTYLYGITSSGGANNKGTIYRIKPDGTEYGIAYSFTGGTTGGSSPYEAPIFVGSTFYGMTYDGGANGLGTVYKVGTDGSGFEILHSFSGGETDGSYAQGGLIADGTTLYGMTPSGGSASNLGTVFKIQTNGTGYAVLHSFAGGNSDGRLPIYGSLVLVDATLFGMTQYGGSGDRGIIFCLGTDGTGFAIKHHFQGGEEDGEFPLASLTLDGSTLYGQTSGGGSSSLGTIFVIGTDGSGFEVLHSFAGGSSDGSKPFYDLIRSGSMLYGTTRFGGSTGWGTVFKFSTAVAADVKIIKNADNLNPVPGATVHFTISAVNDGPGDVTGLKVTDVLPAGLTYVTSSSPYGTYDPVTGIWDVGTVAASETAVLSMTVTVNSSGTIVNTATKTAQNEEDTDATDDSDAVTLTTVFQKQLLPPILLTPASGATGLSNSVTLKWQDTNGNPQEVKYKVRIKKAGGSYVNYTLAANTVQYIKSGLTLGKVYYWNVQAVGNGTATKTSVWANGGVDFSFTVAPPVTLIAPVLLAPGNEANGIPLSTTLQWQDTNSSPNEVKYKVRFKIAGGAYVVTTLGADVTSLAKTGLKSGKTYYWSVMALGNGTSTKNSAWPTDFKFTTS